MNLNEADADSDRERDPRTSEILSCAFEVLNTLGHGFLEKPYENALCVEFALRGIPCAQQFSFPILYKSVQVGLYIPDLIVFNEVVVDTKCIERINDHEIGLMLNYLNITGTKVGLILNFKRAKLEWRRVVNSRGPTGRQYPTD